MSAGQLQQQIAPGSRVTLHFRLALPDGTEAVSTFGEQPATVIIGDGDLTEGLEMAIYGMRAGDRQTLTLNRQQAFGDRDEARIQMVPRHRFPADMTLSKGLVIAFESDTGEEIAGTINDDTDEQGILVDFNHPLAGQDVVFTVEILAVSSV